MKSPLEAFASFLWLCLWFSAGIAFAHLAH